MALVNVCQLHIAQLWIDVVFQIVGIGIIGIRLFLDNYSVHPILQKIL